MKRTRQIREILLAIVDLYREKNGDSLSQWLACVKIPDFSPTGRKKMDNFDVFIFLLRSRSWNTIFFVSLKSVTHIPIFESRYHTHLPEGNKCEVFH